MLLFWVQVLGLNLVLSSLWEKWPESNAKELLFSVPSLGPVVLKLHQYSTFHVLAVLLLWKQISNQVEPVGYLAENTGVWIITGNFSLSPTDTNCCTSGTKLSHQHLHCHLLVCEWWGRHWLLPGLLYGGAASQQRCGRCVKFLSSQWQESFPLWSEEAKL